MAAKDHVRVLRELVELRRLQKAVAEAAAVQAARVVEDANVEVDEHRTRLADHDQCWSRAMSRQTVDLDLAGSWRFQCEATRRELEVSTINLQRATDAQGEAVTVVTGAVGRLKVVQDLAQRSHRQSVRREQEAALSEAADRTARSRGRR
jgi:hypothetical protein